MLQRVNSTERLVWHLYEGAWIRSKDMKNSMTTINGSEDVKPHDL